MLKRLAGPWKGLSFKTRMIALALGLFVLSMGALVYYASRLLQEDLQDVLGAQLYSTASFIAEGLDREMNERAGALELVADGLSPQVQKDPSALQALLEQRPLLQRQFNGGVFATGLDGTAVADVPREAGRIGVNDLDRNVVAIPLREGRTTVGRPALGKKLGAPVFSIATPLRDAQGRPSGALVGTVNLGVPNFLDSVALGRYGRTGGFLLVVPQHNLIVTASDRSRVMQPVPAPGVNAMHDRYMQGYEGYGVARNSRGVVELSAARRMASTGWFFVVLVPTEEAFAPIRAMQQRMVAGAALLMGLTAGLLWWAMSGMLRRQFLPIVETARSLAEQAGSDRLARLIPVASHDEMGELIEGFNSLLGRLGQREGALRASESRLRAIIEAEPDCIKTLDGQGRIVQINAAGLGLIEADTQAPVLGLRLLELVTPEHREAYTRLHQSVLAGESARLEFECVGLRGGRRWLETHAVPLRDSGSVLHLAVTRDISARKRENEQVRKLSRIAEQAPLSIVITNLYGNIEYANPYFADKSLYAVQEVLGCNPRILRSGQTPPQVYHELWQTLMARRVWRGELSNRKKNGELYVERVVIAPVVESDGRVTHYVALKEDVTEEKRAEHSRIALSQRIGELSRRLVRAQEEARLRFAQELHDRTSPNLAALSISLCVIDRGLAHPQKPGEPSIADRIADTRALIEDTTASIREICAGLHPAAIEHGGLLGAVRSYAQQFARRTGIEVRVDCLHDEIRLDTDLELALFRVVQEALTNCAKHADAQRVNIAMRLDCHPITLSIVDDGRGFAPPPHNTGRPLPGLGLINMRETVEFAGGGFTLESAPGCGTRIWVEISGAAGGVGA